ncbi:GNAT family N-acetyltransferase [Niallia hominis]|uniref:GNAT family N-acetyltransferase n=1 Tax=Niallia hominis TaxID=3133173 RepID=A0ABV1F4G8_9BACI
MCKYEVILFDLDGTISDPKEGITKSVQYALQKLGKEEPDLDKLERFIGPPLQESFPKYYGYNEEITNQAIALYRKRFSQSGMFENELYPSISMLLDLLQKEGRILIVATSKPTIFAETILKYFQIEQYFTQIIGSNLDGTRTSKTEIIQYIVELYPSYQLSDFVMIGDREHDIIGAKNVGIDSIGVTYGYGSYEELHKANASYIVESIDQLTDILIGRKNERKQQINLVTEDEAPLVHRLMLEAFEDYRYVEVPSSALNEPIDKLTDALKNGTEQAILYRLNAIPLGSSRLQLKGDSLYFSRLSVTPSARGKGIAQEMLAWMEEYALLNGKQKMECKVRANVRKNISLYEKLGFIITKEEEANNPNGKLVKTVNMEKQIKRKTPSTI